MPNEIAPAQMLRMFYVYPLFYPQVPRTIRAWAEMMTWEGKEQHGRCSGARRGNRGRTGGGGGRKRRQVGGAHRSGACRRGVSLPGVYPVEFAAPLGAQWRELGTRGCTQ